METDLAIARTRSIELAREPNIQSHSGGAPLEADRPADEKPLPGVITETDTSTGEKAEYASDHDNQNVHIEGFQLMAVMGSLVLSCFLMLLDTSIISTVSSPSWSDLVRVL
jgi:hypothetical protein